MVVVSTAVVCAEAGAGSSAVPLVKPMMMDLCPDQAPQKWRRRSSVEMQRAIEERKLHEASIKAQSQTQGGTWHKSVFVYCHARNDDPQKAASDPHSLLFIVCMVLLTVGVRGNISHAAAYGILKHNSCYKTTKRTKGGTQSGSSAVAIHLYIPLLILTSFLLCM